MDTQAIGPGRALQSNVVSAPNIILLNVRSGRQQRRSWAARELKALIEAWRADCALVVVQSGRRLAEAARRAVEGPYRTIIAAGGDGTINAVASQVIGTNKRLGVLPLGTFNYFARELGVPLNLKQAFETCLTAGTARIAVGEINERIFLNNASVGLYPVLLSARERTYRRWGRSRFAAYCSLMRTLVHLRLNMTLTITANGGARTFDTPMVFVARNAYQLEEFGVPGAGPVHEDAFSVFVLPPAGPLGLMRLAGRTLMRRLEPETDFDLINTDEMRIDSSRMFRFVACDGERLKMLAPLHFRVRNHVLNVIVPGKEYRRETA